MRYKKPDFEVFEEMAYQQLMEDAVDAGMNKDQALAYVEDNLADLAYEMSTDWECDIADYLYDLKKESLDG